MTVATPIREIHVAVAVVIRDGKVLIARRPDHVHQGGLLEFPGGKVEAGESVQQALVRELAEETGLTVPETSLEPVIGIRHNYGDKQVFLDVWRTAEAQGTPEGREGQPIEWLAPSSLDDDDFPAANRPIIRALRLPSVLAITGPMASVEQGVARLVAGLKAKPQALVLLRAPELEPAGYRNLAQQALPLCRQAGAGVLVHGAPERFHETPGAAGVHLPWREAATLQTRPIGSEAWLGVSCHNAEQIAHAQRLGADYVTLGPVQPTATHPGADAMGWTAFQSLVAAAAVPVYGLGGLADTDAGRARREGGQGVAGIRFWWPEH